MDNEFYKAYTLILNEYLEVWKLKKKKGRKNRERKAGGL